jgi:hypothetical protein
MSSTHLFKKECSFVNPNPTQIDPVYIFPRDSVSIFYDESSLPPWDNFLETTSTERALNFSCVGAIDELDNYRLNCSFISGSITFVCYGDYEKLAKEAMESIIKKHSRLK